MKTIRKILKDKRDQQRKQHNTMLIVRKQEPLQIYKTLTIEAEKIIKFAWDHWIHQNSLIQYHQSQRSRYFQCLGYFKRIINAKKEDNCVIFYLDKQDKTNQRTKLQFFVQKYKNNPNTYQFSVKLAEIQNMEHQIRLKYLKEVKDNSGPFTSLGKHLIRSLFIKSVKNFKNTPFMAIGNNINFSTMKPYIESVAISYSLLEILQRDVDEFIVQCIQSQNIPDVFTNYGFQQWNASQFKMVHQILKGILHGSKKNVGVNPSRESVRQIIDSCENKKKVLMRSSFEVPILAAFQIIKIISEQSYNIIKTKKQNLNKTFDNFQRQQLVNKILYPSPQFKKYVEDHTASFRDIPKQNITKKNDQIDHP